MPAIETAYRRQKAVLWPWSGYDSYAEPLRGEPVEIDVRWLNKSREVPGPQGSPITVDATAVVDREIVVGSLMWLGELADWYGTGSAGDDTALMEVVAYGEVPDLKGRDIRRTVGLVYFRDTPPAGA